MAFKTPMGRVRGHGAARTGTQTFWHQRLTALALVPLTLFFVAAMITVTGKSYAEAVAYVGSPLVAVLLLAFLVIGFYHMKLGLIHVVEDYVHGELTKIGLIVLINLGTLLLGLACVYSVLKLGFGPAVSIDITTPL